MKFYRHILLAILIIPIFATVAWAMPNDLQFSQAEEEFIKNHREIRLGVDPKFIPYEFFDTDGEYKGIAADYIQLLSERTGLKMTVAKNMTWSEAYEKAVQKQLDVLPCVSRTQEREKYFLYSQPYYTFQRVIYVQEGNHQIKSFADLSGMKVAVQTNSSHHSYLQTFPTVKLSLYATAEESLQAVANGQETAFIGNLATSNYLIKANGITGLKSIKMETEQQQSLYFAVRNDWPELVGIINKGLASITEEDRININNRWIGVEQKPDYREIIRIAGMIGIVLAIAFMISFYWILRLKREVIKRKEIQKDLRIAKDEAETANHIKSLFLARMSHEIRTPLNAIMGMAYLIKKTDISKTQRVYLDSITQSSINMLAIINDILDFSKVEAGKIEMEEIPFNLDKVLAQVVSMSAIKIEEQEIDFSIHKDPVIPTYYKGDPNRVTQVLLNVINNAVKFTRHGIVSVAIELLKKEGTYAVLEMRVKDTGIGMSAEQISKIFQPFDQAEASISRRYGGTGLGLAISKSLVEMMGGDIQVQSQLNEGSTFIIHLRLQVDYAKEYEEKDKSSSYFQDIRVLLIEKSPFYTNLLKEYLHAFHIESDFASSEMEALQLMDKAKAESRTYDLLILDYETPSDGGIVFFNRLKHTLKPAELPKCILMIPLTREDLLERIEAEGIDFGLNKPILPSILYNAIVEIFKLKVLEIHDAANLAGTQDKRTVDYPYHVLIVEDNKTNQFIAQSILEQFGFRVSLADDGKAGYEFFTAHQDNLDLILMDLHMPVCNGFEASKLIRKMDAKIPIVAMTADAITGIREKCLRVGIDYYISKPFDPDEMLSTLLEILESSGIEEVQFSQEIKEASSRMEAILDEADGLGRLGGNTAIYQMVLQEYYQENVEVPAVLAEKMAAKDYLEVVQIVHKIKSSSGNIGARRLFALASKLQNALKDENENEILGIYQVFQEQLDLVLQEIKRKLAL